MVGPATMMRFYGRKATAVMFPTADQPARIRGSQMWIWMVHIYVGRDPETRKRQHTGKSIDGGLRAAQTHLNHMPKVK